MAHDGSANASCAPFVARIYAGDASQLASRTPIALAELQAISACRSAHSLGRHRQSGRLGRAGDGRFDRNGLEPASVRDTGAARAVVRFCTTFREFGEVSLYYSAPSAR